MIQQNIFRSQLSLIHRRVNIGIFLCFCLQTRRALIKYRHNNCITQVADKTAIMAKQGGEDRINSGNDELDKKIEQWLSWDKVKSDLYANVSLHTLVERFRENR